MTEGRAGRQRRIVRLRVRGAHPRNVPAHSRRLGGARLAIVLAAALSGAAGTARDPFTGTWVLDPPRDGPATHTQVLTIKVEAGVETYRSDLMTPDGRRQITDYAAPYDGQEHPSVTRLSGGGRPDETKPGGVMLHWTDINTRERYWKTDGRLFRILRRTVGDGGCAMRSQLIDVSPDGVERPGGVLSFTRQDPACVGSAAAGAPSPK